jgi:hypothetical protein
MNSDRSSATIYQFPIRGCFAGVRREDAKVAETAVPVLRSSAWYHEAAIEDVPPPTRRRT